VRTMTRTWRLMLDDAHDGYQNMSQDTALFDDLEKAGGRQPTLRVYLWNPWTVSVGQGQTVEDVLDIQALKQRGYNWVRRPTGGRTVFHAQEITYALAAPTQWHFEKGSQTHERIGNALLRFYAQLGINAELTRPATREELSPKNPAPCFLAPGLAEVQFEGRKLAGSAQRRGRNAFLQHGSILLGPRHLELAEFAPISPEKQQRLREAMLRSSGCLADFVKRVPPIRELQRMLAKSFEAEFGIEWE
jgi:lipoate-protein ligase A